MCIKSSTGFITKSGLSISQENSLCQFVSTNHNGYCKQCKETYTVYNEMMVNVK